MAESKSVLKRLHGKRVCLHGKFSYGVKELLAAKARAQGGEVIEDLEAKVDFLVLQDASAGVGIQKKVLALNAKGATIQVMGAEAFDQVVAPTEADMLALIRGGKENAELMGTLAGVRAYYYAQRQGAPMFSFAGERFEGLDLSGMSLSHLAFEDCSFSGARIEGTSFGVARGCDFRKC